MGFSLSLPHRYTYIIIIIIIIVIIVNLIIIIIIIIIINIISIRCPGEGNHPLAGEAGRDGPPRPNVDGL